MDDTTLMGYETVIWFTGMDYQNALTSDDKARLTAFMAAGGKLILSGQDLGYGMKTDSFLNGTLKAKYLKDNSGSTEVSGFGMEFSIQGGDGANNQKYPDVVEALEGGEAIFEYGNNKGVAGVRAGNGTYLAFGFEGVSTAQNRAALMGKLLAGDANLDTVSEPARNVLRKSAFEGMKR